MISKLFFIFLLLPLSSHAAIKAVATTPEGAWLLHRIGGGEVEVKTLAKPNDNYHFLEARPDFILAVNRAEIVCRIGLDLELGWLPKVFARAANRKVTNGEKGDCVLSRYIKVLEKPTIAVDRSMGDTHSSGNPHFWFSPTEMGNAAREVEEKLSLISPEKASVFKTNRENLEKELSTLQLKLKEKLKPLQGNKALQYHRDFSYFFSDYGLELAGSIEEIPGVSPSAARLGNVALDAKKNKVAIALAGEHDSKSALKKFEELSGIPVAVLPTSLSKPEERDAFEKWQTSLVEKILKGK